MKTLRQTHLYLGCFFAPMIFYYLLSGVWQVFRFNDPLRKPKLEVISTQTEKPEIDGSKDLESQSFFRTLLGELSKPHKNSTWPGASPKNSHSRSFDYLAAAMGLGLSTTTLLGIILALQVPKRRQFVVGTLILGSILPVVLLYGV